MDRPKIRWILHPITLQDSDSRHSPSVSRPLSTLRKKPIEIPTMPLHNGSAGGLSNGRDYRLPYATPGERRVPRGTSDLQHGRTAFPKLPSRFDEYGGDLSSSSLEILFEETHNPSEKNSQPESHSRIQSGERAGPWQSPGPSISGPSSTGHAAYFNSSTSPHTSLPSTKSQDGIKESISGQHGSVSVPHNLPALLSITQPAVPDYLPNVVPPQQFIPWPTSSFQFSFSWEDHSAPVVPSSLTYWPHIPPPMVPGVTSPPAPQRISTSSMVDSSLSGNRKWAPPYQLPTSGNQPMGPTSNTDVQREAQKSPPTPSGSGPSPDEFVSPPDNLCISSGLTEVQEIPETESPVCQIHLETESFSLIESATGDEEFAVNLPIPKKSRVEVEEIPPEEVSKVVDDRTKKKKGRGGASLQREVAQLEENSVDFLKGTGDSKSRRCRSKSVALVGNTEEGGRKRKESADILVTPPGLFGRKLYACGNMGCNETAKTASLFKVGILHVIFENDSKS